MSQSTVAERLSKLLETGKYSDLQFVFDNGKKVKGHKLIFAISSPVFEAMLYGDLADKDDVKIVDLEPEIFKTMAKFIYSDQLDLDSVNHAMAVFKVGDKYDLQDVVKKAEKYLSSNIGVENVLDVLQFSKFYNLSCIEKLCMVLLEEKAQFIFVSENSLNCCLTVLDIIVNEDSLNANEMELFSFVDRWAKRRAQGDGASMSSVRLLLNDVLSKIRFGVLSTDDYINSIHESELFTLEEKHILCVYSCSPHDKPLPHGFCNSTELRNARTRSQVDLNVEQGLFVVKLTWASLSKVIFGKRYLSSSFYFVGSTFYVCFFPYVKSNYQYGEVLLYCHCSKLNLHEKWEFGINYSFSLRRCGTVLGNGTFNYPDVFEGLQLFNFDWIKDVNNSEKLEVQLTLNI